MALPLAIPIGAALLGSFLKHKGQNKAQDQFNKQQEAEWLRAQQAEDQRARARANMMAGILKGYGKGGGVDAETLYQMFRRNIAKGQPASTGGRNMSFLGGGLSGIAQMMMLGMKKPSTGQVDFSGLAGIGDSSMGIGGGIGAGAAGMAQPPSELFG